MSLSIGASQTKIIASDRFLNTFHERQRRLAFNLLLFQLIISVGYFIYLTVFVPEKFSSFFLPAFIFSTLISIFLWFSKRYQSTIVFDLVALNILLFLISERVTIYTGVDLYYVAIGSATLALFGYEYWRAGVAFALLSLCLFLASRFFSFDAISTREFSQQQEEVFFFINSIAASGISIYCVVTVMKLNFETQKKLQKITTTVEEQNTELKKTNDELDRFVYSASHDLRSPLSSIKGLVNVFELDKEGKKEEYLPKIKDRIQTMDKFIKEITDYSRNTRVQVSMEFILLNPLVKEIIESAQYTDHADQINFVVEIQDDFVIRSDVYRLKIVLNNIISNAIKYADMDKEHSFVKVKAHKNESMAVIQIIDNGIGIKSEHLDKIFNMFYRATEQSTGSGLGLYIVNESIKKMNGTIAMESEIGKGATFTLRLPQNT